MEKTANTTVRAMLEAGEATTKVFTNATTGTQVELVARCELDNHPNGWGYVRPGRRARRHRKELRLAKQIFGLVGQGNIWWLPVGWKRLDAWTMADYGLVLPEFIPLPDGMKTGDYLMQWNTILLPEESPTGNACTAMVRVVFRFSEDVGISSEDVPAYWEKGRRHMA